MQWMDATRTGNEMLNNEVFNNMEKAKVEKPPNIHILEKYRFW